MGRGFFWLVIFRLIALRLGVLSDSGREDRFLKGARKEVRMRRRWGMESHAKTRRRKEDRDPGICDVVGRGVFVGYFSADCFAS